MDLKIGLSSDGTVRLVFTEEQLVELRRRARILRHSRGFTVATASKKALAQFKADDGKTLKEMAELANTDGDKVGLVLRGLTRQVRVKHRWVL